MSYSRLYHRFPDEFPAVYASDRALAAWVRLLILADASWPLRPPLPRSVRSGTIRELADAGVLVVDGDSYTIRGLDAERTRRRDAARTGAVQRWHSNGNADASANGHATAMPRRDETRKERAKVYETSESHDRGPRRLVDPSGKR